MASATLVGTALWWATPFRPWHAAGLSLVISVMGFSGGMVMSAIKRDRGVKDYGTLVVGHGGVLGPHRLDLLRRPVFFHLTRFYLERRCSKAGVRIGGDRPFQSSVVSAPPPTPAQRRHLPPRSVNIVVRRG